MTRSIELCPYHWHDEVVLIKVLRGAIKIHNWGKSEEFKKEDFIILNSGEIYHLEEVTKENLVLFIYFSKDFCRETVEQFNEVVILCNTASYESKIPKPYKELREYIIGLQDIFTKGKGIEEKTVRYKVASEFLKFLCESFDYVTCGIGLHRFSPKVRHRYKRLYRAVMLPDGELAKSSLKEIASYVDISYLHLRKDLIQRYGYGFTWLKNTRMVEQAAKMILTSSDSITQISYVCGFSDPKYMIKSFKVYFGYTPSKFRQKYRDIPQGGCRYIEYEEYQVDSMALTGEDEDENTK